MAKSQVYNSDNKLSGIFLKYFKKSRTNQDSRPLSISLDLKLQASSLCMGVLVYNDKKSLHNETGLPTPWQSVNKKIQLFLDCLVQKLLIWIKCYNKKK